MTDLRAYVRRRSAPDEHGCWIWSGALARNGYGQVQIRTLGIKDTAHRVAFLAFHGPVPAGLDVMHSCDVRACVNPDHLSAGTRSENLMDAGRKGRLAEAARGRAARRCRNEKGQFA